MTIGTVALQRSYGARMRRLGVAMGDSFNRQGVLVVVAGRGVSLVSSSMR